MEYAMCISSGGYAVTGQIDGAKYIMLANGKLSVDYRQRRLSIQSHRQRGQRRYDTPYLGAKLSRRMLDTIIYE